MALTVLDGGARFDDGLRPAEALWIVGFRFAISGLRLVAVINYTLSDGLNAIFVSGAKLLGDANLPAIFAFTESVEAGGLMAYSFDLIELYKRVANNIDAILRGAKPGDIPIYQVTKFELSINLKTAKQLGLSVPPALVAIADKVIE